MSDAQGGWRTAANESKKATGGGESETFRMDFPDGSFVIEHRVGARPEDWPDGTAAVRWFNASGDVYCEGHYRDGQLHDPDDGTPASRFFKEDGTIRVEAHYKDGVRVEEEEEKR